MTLRKQAKATLQNADQSIDTLTAQTSALIGRTDNLVVAIQNGITIEAFIPGPHSLQDFLTGKTNRIPISLRVIP
jgi:hypothetical protein